MRCVYDVARNIPNAQLLHRRRRHRPSLRCWELVVVGEEVVRGAC
jgi:hypothetical protein